MSQNMQLELESFFLVLIHMFLHRCISQKTAILDKFGEKFGSPNLTADRDLSAACVVFEY